MTRTFLPIVKYVLARPYTVVAALILVGLLGIGEALRMPVDIFPRMDIPVVSVVWTYAGMSAADMQNRILTLHERQLASLVDDISRIEATSYEGVGVEKIYLHEGADVTRAVAQLASSALVVLKYMPPNITPPLVIRYGATDVPIIQLAHLLICHLTRAAHSRARDYSTGHGFAFQISVAYSAMVRSLENFPEAATFKMAMSAHSSGLAYRSHTRSSASR